MEREISKQAGKKRGGWEWNAVNANPNANATAGPRIAGVVAGQSAAPRSYMHTMRYLCHGRLVAVVAERKGQQERREG